MNLPSALIVDIDGTIALKGDRSIFDMTKVSLDTPNWPIVRLVRVLREKFGMCLFVSGRDESARKDTRTWMYQECNLYGPLYMRPIGDGTKDAVLKRRIYEFEIQPSFDVKYVLDDRDQCVKMWRELGLPTLQVAEGAF